MCVCGSLRGGERQRRSGLEAAAEVAGPGGATAAGKPRRPETEGRRLRGHSLRYLPAGKEDKEAVGTQPAQARRYHQCRSPDSPLRCSQNRCADLFGIAVSAPAHTAPGHPLGMGGESRRRRPRSGGRGRRGAGGEPAAGRVGAGYSVSPSAAAGPPRTGCTAASRPPRTEGWCWSASARGTA